MRVTRILLPCLLLLNVYSFAQHRLPPSPPRASVSTTSTRRSILRGFLTSMLRQWMKKVDIPADRSSWASFTELDERNLDIERGILEKAQSGSASRNAIDQKIGDLYGSCMDEKTVNTRHRSAQPELDRVAAVKDKGALIDESRAYT